MPRKPADGVIAGSGNQGVEEVADRLAHGRDAPERLGDGLSRGLRGGDDGVDHERDAQPEQDPLHRGRKRATGNMAELLETSRSQPDCPTFPELPERRAGRDSP
jgi:hypothetical protein